MIPQNSLEQVDLLLSNTQKKSVVFFLTIVLCLGVGRRLCAHFSGAVVDQNTLGCNCGKCTQGKFVGPSRKLVPLGLIFVNSVFLSLTTMMVLLYVCKFGISPFKAEIHPITYVISRIWQKWFSVTSEHLKIGHKKDSFCLAFSVCLSSLLGELGGLSWGHSSSPRERPRPGGTKPSPMCCSLNESLWKWILSSGQAFGWLTAADILTTTSWELLRQN